MDFGAQSAFAAPDRLVFAVFFWAPALCWCARTIVLSIMAYSLSASAANISNIFFGCDPDMALPSGNALQFCPTGRLAKHIVAWVSSELS